MICRICGFESVDARSFLVNDKMFNGTEKFCYDECPNCGTMQIRDIPTDMSAFYPPHYYSLNSHQTFSEKWVNRVRDLIFYYRFPEFVFQKLRIKIPNLALEAFLKTKPKKSFRILDVGCGEGKFLTSIFQLGFKNGMGIEPFALKEQLHPFPIYKKRLSEVQGSFDCITFNHVFEHVDDVHETLEKSYELLSENGFLMIRVPVKDSYAYQHYRENWVQRDAPRHFQLFTHKAFEILAEKHHFLVEDYYCDSYKFQFTGSEKYERGQSYQTSNSIFSKSEIQNFNTKAQELNHGKKGDQVVVILRKKEI